ncbi:hypothetical protein JOD63_001545 [Microbacterium terrae]|uniref:Uncharacterized protein n=1 Tax=Microbacterium terrae TaxID=69369 RepID=A0A0M2GWP1_9MICO|nr:hypothetical protein [Microbacterium terrae]KJL38164.1 hypothetical protein RS81_03162 [Microbacterium terrae]MBP1077577.1 hypothetical protein [Microbacterium terrae]GLJ99182.1 hypothetical protein GCM10017594_23790 [Microbacterium terrae]
MTDRKLDDNLETAVGAPGEDAAANAAPADATSAPIDEVPADATTAGDPVSADAPAEAAPIDEVPAAFAPEPPRAEPASSASAEDAPQYGVGPFSLREVVLGGLWLVAFVVSFFPVVGQIGTGLSVWGSGIDWVLTIGVPTVAVFLIGLRRLSPQGIRRVGSLGIDQFASVAFSVSTLVWLGIIWNSFITLANQRFFAATWVVWVEFFVMLAGVLLTVFGAFIAPFDQDFRGRAEVPAHRYARPVRAVTARPVVERVAPAAAAPATDAAPAETAAPIDDSVAPSEPDPAVSDATQAYTITEDDSLEPAAARDTFEPVEAATTAADAGAPRHQAFWALAPEERDVVDEVGIPIFRVGPTAWALVLEDRGDSFVVRHEDGRIGYLHDVSGVTRG